MRKNKLKKTKKMSERTELDKVLDVMFYIMNRPDDSNNQFTVDSLSKSLKITEEEIKNIIRLLKPRGFFGEYCLSESTIRYIGVYKSSIKTDVDTTKLRPIKILN